jgi:hypothetical protein
MRSPAPQWNPDLGGGGLHGLLKERTTIGRHRVDMIENVDKELDRRRPEVFVLSDTEFSRNRCLITGNVIEQRVTQCH